MLLRPNIVIIVLIPFGINVTYCHLFNSEYYLDLMLPFYAY